MLIFFSSAQSVYFNQIFLLLCIWTFSDFGPYQSVCWKKHSIAAELAGHAYKLDEKLQSLCGNGFSLFAVHMLAEPYHVGVNWPTTLCQNKDMIHFFTLDFECHDRDNKVLLCNSENCDVAWCNKNNCEWGFSFFNKKQTIFSILKKSKKRFFLKQKKQVGCFFSQPCFPWDGVWGLLPCIGKRKQMELQNQIPPWPEILFEGTAKSCWRSFIEESFWRKHHLPFHERAQSLG